MIFYIHTFFSSSRRCGLWSYSLIRARQKRQLFKSVRPPANSHSNDSFSLAFANFALYRNSHRIFDSSCSHKTPDQATFPDERDKINKWENFKFAQRIKLLTLLFRRTIFLSRLLAEMEIIYKRFFIFRTHSRLAISQQGKILFGACACDCSFIPLCVPPMMSDSSAGSNLLSSSLSTHTDTCTALGNPLNDSHAAAAAAIVWAA
jgi:hypothetical protein